MERSAIYHRPESEYAYLYQRDVLHVRLQTKRDDVASVRVLHGDPYLFLDYQWCFAEGANMVKIATSADHDYWHAVLTSETQRVQYAFVVEGHDGERVLYGEHGAVSYTDAQVMAGNNYFRLPFFHELDRFKAPNWVKSTVWYQIFPERFANGDLSISPDNVIGWYDKANPESTDFYGGDLQGIIDKLDYLVDLGINGIYLCPIFEASTNHKYDTIDYFKIDRHFGDEQLFKTLIREAHHRGIRVMIDAVFNHIGAFSPQCQDVLQNQERSRYVDWFHIRQFPIVPHLSRPRLEGIRELSYAAFAFSAMLPKLNTANPEVQAFLLDVGRYWVKECGIDAWRLDVANEVDHQFWKMFRREMTKLKPDIYILGEVWHSAQKWLEGDEFHAVMNYTFTDSIRDYFVTQTIDAQTLIDRLQLEMMRHRRQASEVMFNLLDSHDTARLLTLAYGRVAAVQSALAFMFLQIGSPCIYYGTEVGMTGGGDPDCRKPMWWREDWQNHEMLAFTKRLIQFRRTFSHTITYGQAHYVVENGVVRMIRKDRSFQLVGYFNGTSETKKVMMEGLIQLHNQAEMNQTQLKPFEFVILQQNY